MRWRVRAGGVGSRLDPLDADARADADADLAPGTVPPLTEGPPSDACREDKRSVVVTTVFAAGFAVPVVGAARGWSTGRATRTERSPVMAQTVAVGRAEP